MIIDRISDLEVEVKKIWPHFHSLRLNGVQVEFSVSIGKDELAWFPYYRSPTHVEKYINAYLKIS